MEISRYTAATLWPELVSEMDKLGKIRAIDTRDVVTELGMLVMRPCRVYFTGRAGRQVYKQPARSIDLIHAS